MSFFSSIIKKGSHISDSDFTYKIHVQSRILKGILVGHVKGFLKRAGSTKHCFFQSKESCNLTFLNYLY